MSQRPRHGASTMLTLQPPGKIACLRRDRHGSDAPVEPQGAGLDTLDREEALDPMLHRDVVDVEPRPVAHGIVQ